MKLFVFSSVVDYNNWNGFIQKFLFIIQLLYIYNILIHLFYIYIYIYCYQKSGCCPIVACIL